MKKFKLSSFLWLLLVIFNVVVMGSFIITFVLNGFSFSRASFFGYRIVTVMSQSMEPTLDTYSMAISDMTHKDYQVGDIVVYEHELEDGKILIVHRIVEKTSDGYITKGDNNPVSDSWIVKEEDIVGRICNIMNWTSPILKFILGGK